MARFTVAFADRGMAETIAGILSENGFDVFHVCTGTGEVLRAFNQCEDGILVSGYKLKDGTAEQLAENLNDAAEILVLAKRSQLELLENRRIFRLALPLKKEALLSSADLLVQLHYQKLPHRDPVRNEVIREAKEYLMKQRNMTESQAHQFIQKMSMRSGLRMEQIARQILDSAEG